MLVDSRSSRVVPCQQEASAWLFIMHHSRACSSVSHKYSFNACTYHVQVAVQMIMKAIFTFVIVIKERKAEYMATDCRPLKKKIATEIVDAVLASGSRFLKKADANDRKKLGIPEGIKAWCILHREAMDEKVKQALRQKSWAATLYSPQQQSAEKRPSGKKQKRRANESSPDSVRVKKRRSQMVSSSELATYSQVVSSFQAEPSSIDLTSDMHILDEDPEPLDWRGVTANSSEGILNAFYSRQINSPKSTMAPWDVDYCCTGAGEATKLKGEVMRSVSITSNDTEEWDDCEEFCGQRFYPFYLDGDSF